MHSLGKKSWKSVYKLTTLFYSKMFRVKQNVKDSTEHWSREEVSRMKEKHTQLKLLMYSAHVMLRHTITQVQLEQEQF